MTSTAASADKSGDIGAVSVLTERTWELLSEEEKKHLTVGDYLDGEGLWRCGVCHKVKGRPDAFLTKMSQERQPGGPNWQLVGAVMGEKSLKMNWPCCDCFFKAKAAEELKAKAARYREDCFPSKRMWEMTFENSTRRSPEIESAKSYVKNFDLLRKDGFGMALFGECGTGKTHIAAMIANALIDRGLRVRFCQLETLFRDYTAERDKNEFLRRLSASALVVIDDLGAESPQLKAFAFTVIDTLYRDMTPFVITTNSDIKDVSSNADKTEQRLFTRIFERCPTPIYISDAGGSIRGEKTVQSKKRYRELLNIAPNA